MKDEQPDMLVVLLVLLILILIGIVGYYFGYALGSLLT